MLALVVTAPEAMIRAGLAAEQAPVADPFQIAVGMLMIAIGFGAIAYFSVMLILHDRYTKLWRAHMAATRFFVRRLAETGFFAGWERDDIEAFIGMCYDNVAWDGTFSSWEEVDLRACAKNPDLYDVISAAPEGLHIEKVGTWIEGGNAVKVTIH